MTRTSLVLFVALLSLFALGTVGCQEAGHEEAPATEASADTPESEASPEAGLISTADFEDGTVEALGDTEDESSEGDTTEPSEAGDASEESATDGQE